MVNCKQLKIKFKTLISFYGEAKCNNCGFLFCMGTMLGLHLWRHIAIGVTCSVCNNCFHTEELLGSHLLVHTSMFVAYIPTRQAHTKNKKLPFYIMLVCLDLIRPSSEICNLTCNLCGKTFVTNACKITLVLNL